MESTSTALVRLPNATPKNANDDKKAKLTVLHNRVLACIFHSSTFALRLSSLLHIDIETCNVLDKLMKQNDNAQLQVVATDNTPEDSRSVHTKYLATLGFRAHTIKRIHWSIGEYFDFLLSDRFLEVDERTASIIVAAIEVDCDSFAHFRTSDDLVDTMEKLNITKYMSEESVKIAKELQVEQKRIEEEKVKKEAEKAKLEADRHEFDMRVQRVYSNVANVLQNNGGQVQTGANSQQYNFHYHAPAPNYNGWTPQMGAPHQIQAQARGPDLLQLIGAIAADHFNRPSSFIPQFTGFHPPAHPHTYGMQQHMAPMAPNATAFRSPSTHLPFPTSPLTPTPIWLPIAHPSSI